jgi:hypothetical protein
LFGVGDLTACKPVRLDLLVDVGLSGCQAVYFNQLSKVTDYQASQHAVRAGAQGCIHIVNSGLARMGRSLRGAWALAGPCFGQLRRLDDSL